MAHTNFEAMLPGTPGFRADYREFSPFDGEPLEASKRAYKAKSGDWQIKPMTELLADLDEADLGFCLNCGAQDQEVEPDAARYTCECCGAPKVFGAAELALRGLYF